MADFVNGSGTNVFRVARFLRDDLFERIGLGKRTALVAGNDHEQRLRIVRQQDVDAFEQRGHGAVRSRQIKIVPRNRSRIIDDVGRLATDHVRVCLDDRDLFDVENAGLSQRKDSTHGLGVAREQVGEIAGRDSSAFVDTGEDADLQVGRNPRIGDDTPLNQRSVVLIVVVEGFARVFADIFSTIVISEPGQHLRRRKKRKRRRQCVAVWH